ncbi:nuclear transport factor 2 family protein [Rivibacter subsaxonicus]|uniref:SnoaL-like protein n=1 Tax=Rivibacter subsaxonicus TaxID=457575 RepID=A0A4Q7VWA8_9BURK|nr:nuclear transport factor 2 family protein [Rivibacter subsaxonicus]RZU00981.1 SnoaL-like protein [Rivibacter subsaxonicus]
MSLARQDGVRRLWQAFEARDWAAAQALFAPDAVCDWWTSGERFTGAAAIVGVNAAYPEGWHIELLAVDELVDGRIHSLVRVDQDAQSFYANSFFGFDAEGRITAVEEFWATFETPPTWRDGLPGRTRLPPRPATLRPTSS